jgi:hypothetical protein
VLLFAADADSHGLLEHARHLEQRYPGLVLARVISSGPGPTDQPWLVHDPAGAAHRAYGADHPTSFVIRPDGHLAARIRPATGPALTADLNTRLATTPTRPPQPSSTP